MVDQQQFQQVLKGLRERLDAAEHQLALLSEKAGVPYERPGDPVSPEVRRLVAEGKRMDAIRELRKDGMPFEDARAIVERM